MTSGAGAFPPDSASGSRLRRYLPEFEAVNLLDRFPGKSYSWGKGDLFVHRAARDAAERMSLRGRTVLLCGWYVAGAFGLRRLSLFRWVGFRGGIVAVVPHPSGVNHWWNTPSNERMAARFFEEAVELDRRERDFLRAVGASYAMEMA